MLWSLGYKIAHAILYPGPVCTCREYCVVGGIFWLPTHSGAGMNMKVGAPVRRESGGTHPAQSAGKNFLVAPLYFFGSTSTIVVWWALLWWSVQFGQFLACCSSTHGTPPCSATCKSGGGRTCPPCTMESAPLPTHRVNTNKKYEKWTLLSADAMTFNLLTLPCKLSKSESLSLCYNHLQAG